MQKTTILMDGHIHLYPEYNLNQAFRLGTENMQKCLQKSSPAASQNVVAVWLLTERWDCNFFQKISAAPEKFSNGDMKLTPASEKLAVVLERKGFPNTYILPGRQLVSKDGLEILSLATDYFVKDRTLSTRELIINVNRKGGVPVLNWAPGKWFFNRGQIVRQILEASQPTEFVVGDNPLRPVCWPKPGLMKLAAQKGFKVIAGSDPLPFAGEEKNIGKYCFITEAGFDANRPVSSVRNILKNNELPATILGKRNGVVTFAIRETRILLKK